MYVRWLCLVLSLLVVSCAPKESRTLVFGRGGDSVGLDPALETDGESFKVCDNIYETLVNFKPENTEVVPGLAESWTVSEDLMMWTFRLRRNVTFHDGTPFNADAVVFSLGRQFMADHPFHRVEGAYQYWNSMSMSDIVRDVRKGDSHTVEIELHDYVADPDGTDAAAVTTRDITLVVDGVITQDTDFGGNGNEAGTVTIGGDFTGSVESRMVTSQVRYRDPGHWLFNKEQAGSGMLSWLACHHIDMLSYLLSERIVEVSAMVANNNPEKVAVEDTEWTA